ncbi:MAG: tyrosine-type recombinase/integrase [Bdellovibrionales bacterium]|nr:tyrosine-type recombinase/integrase [Bdellovibrionales bacterium]
MFRYSGRQFRRSTETADQKEATLTKYRIEETLRLLKQGRVELPEDADPGVWIFSAGKIKEKQSVSKANDKTFGKICDSYLEDQVDKAITTQNSEEIHVRHLKRYFSDSVYLPSLTLDQLQKYVHHRRRMKYRGVEISGKTIRKELVTFRQIWDWARERKLVVTDCPLLDHRHKWIVNIPKPEEKEKFQAWTQIEKRIQRGGLDRKSQKRLWECLFLDEKQIAELLKHVKKKANHPFIYPMFVFVAYTGARRSELCRSLIDDFDFNQNQILIRERKRRKDMEETFRFVPMHSKIRATMLEWFTEHPGGQFTLTHSDSKRNYESADGMVGLNVTEAHWHFKQALKDTKWSVIKGFHVLRHSFGSNLARSGQVSRDEIGEWMGHTTEEMKSLYQHLFPQDGISKIQVLS